jgi:hypothetical protein
MFADVYDALYDQVKASGRLTYVDQSQFLKGFHEGTPAQEYTIIFEPAQEEEEHTESYKTQAGETGLGVIYYIDIHVRVMLTGSTNAILISGDTANNKKGILEVVDDIKRAITDDYTLSYNRPGSSISAANAGTSFALTPSSKNISVSINGDTRSGYDTIFCGDSTLSGDDVASNIQTALRALGQHADDGYYLASCSFNNSSKQFTISTDKEQPDQCVVVTAGASDDCSALLGFDSPTEVCGRNISDIKFETVIPNNTFFPVRYRVIPVKIWEEITR